MNNVTVSFILPHKGRENFLLQTLESIAGQDYDLKRIEVVVITQNEQLSATILNLGNKFSFSVYYRPDSETISALRNFGVKKTSGEYLAFLDADVSLSKNWISSLINELDSKTDRVLVSASQVCSGNAPPLEQIKTALSNAIIDENVNFLPGRNLLLSRNIFNQAGGFPEHLITCEDYYFTDQVHHLGDLYYTSKASYIHLGEDKNYNEMYRKEIWRGQSNLQSIKGRRIPLREIPSFLVPVGIFSFLLLSIALLFTGNFLLAAIAFVLALAPILIYSIRLNTLVGQQANFIEILKFYIYYFPARAIGTLGGIFKTFSTQSHN
jgi:glycosyltransferase involved in cell wall biosynthesis